MIQNGKGTDENHNGTHTKEHKMSFSRPRYERSKQTTGSFQNGEGITFVQNGHRFEGTTSVQNGHRFEGTTSVQNGHRFEGTTSVQNGHCFEKKPVGKTQELRWNQNISADDNGNLSFEQMWELQRIVGKRVKHKISDGLSPEGRMAMELARAEVDNSKTKKKGKTVKILNGTRSCDRLPELELPNSKKRGKVKKSISFVDAYESSSASRLSGDIMDDSSSQGNPKRWALGGGNVHVAMETVEIVSYGDTLSESDADDIAIEETAKLNSVEKCLVWMGVHTDRDFDQER